MRCRPITYTIFDISILFCVIKSRATLHYSSNCKKSCLDNFFIFHSFSEKSVIGIGFVENFLSNMLCYIQESHATFQLQYTWSFFGGFWGCVYFWMEISRKSFQISTFSQCTFLWLASFVCWNRIWLNRDKTHIVPYFLMFVSKTHSQTKNLFINSQFEIPDDHRWCRLHLW